MNRIPHDLIVGISSSTCNWYVYYLKYFNNNDSKFEQVSFKYLDLVLILFRLILPLQLTDYFYCLVSSYLFVILDLRDDCLVLSSEVTYSLLLQGTQDYKGSLPCHPHS